MALADATFAWFADSETADLATPGTLSVDGDTSAGTTQPRSNNDSSYLFVPDESLQYTLSTGEFIAGGTGDFTMAVRTRWDSTNLSGSNRTFHIGNVPNARGLAVEMFSSVGKRPGLFVPGPNLRSESSIAITEAVAFIFVARRLSGAIDFWVDQAKDPAPVDNIGAADLNNTYEDATVGALNGGSGNNLDGALWFAACWDEALTDEECASIDEATLRAALIPNRIFGAGLPASPEVEIVDQYGTALKGDVIAVR